MNRKEIYEDRLAIPLEGQPDQKLYSGSGTLLAIGYVRIVLGGRGPYVEFTKDQIQWDSFAVPENQAWRVDPATRGKSYYIEYRSLDSANVMTYEQLRKVVYADYQIGLIYINPFELCLKNGVYLIERKKTPNPQLSLYA